MRCRIIFCLTSFLCESIHQVVATKDRCTFFHDTWKGESFKWQPRKRRRKRLRRKSTKHFAEKQTRGRESVPLVFGVERLSQDTTQHNFGINVWQTVWRALDCAAPPGSFPSQDTGCGTRTNCSENHG